MACRPCERRAVLIAGLAPAISRLSFTRQGLLGLLALSNEQLLRVVKVEDPQGFLQRVEVMVARNSERVSGGSAMCRHEPGYPEALAQLPSAPAVLYSTCTKQRLGEMLSTGRTVAIVGSRTPSNYGREIAFGLARALTTAGVTVISGMSPGLECTAHEGALRARGHSIAVVPCGPGLAVFSSQKDLHRDVIACGAAVSEYPPGFFPPQRWCFIASQRIIAGLCRIVVVVEVGERSGALLAAGIAADLGVDVAVVPGRVTDPGGRWIFALLRDGAHPISGAQDVLELIGERANARAMAA